MCEREVFLAECFSHSSQPIVALSLTSALSTERGLPQRPALHLDDFDGRIACHVRHREQAFCQW